MKPPSRHVVLICSAGLLIPVIARAQDADLYDPSVLRTLELEFEVPNFFARIDQISTSTEDGYLAGDLTVDGVTYPGVGVRFRGNTSQRNAGEKRSFKISINHTDPDQRLDGFRTLKLNNAAGDPTFLREVLYSRICSEYGPSPTANHVVLTINGENWGVYINVQQFNKDFLRQWFDRTSGNRFKAPSGGGTGPRGPRPPRCNLPGGNFACGYRALMWLGERPPEYQRYYELNSDEQPDPWGDLVRFCDVFNHATDDVFEQRVATILDVDGALWMIALENVFGDHDGYLFKGADYTIYQEPPLPGQESPPGRLHVIQHDANECFQATPWRILQSSGDDQRPLVRRLLAVPRLRARYVAHVRTILDEWFRWDVLGPFATELRDLITDAVDADPRKLHSSQLFRDNFERSVNAGGRGGRLIGLREFVDSRREFLLRQPELDPVPPTVDAVEPALAVEEDGGFADAPPGVEVGVTARVSSTEPIVEVILHHRGRTTDPFDRVQLHDDGADDDGDAGDGVHGGAIPPYVPGSRVQLYVEARTAAATAFAPPRTTTDALVYRVGIVDAGSTPVVLNELMASNDATIADPQGEFDDWVELLNVSSAVVDLAGMYLSDKENNPLKWRFPPGVTLAPGEYLIVWLDEDGQDQTEDIAASGLHANFKLASAGERVWLVDTDARGNARLDATSFAGLATDAAWARSPDGSGEFQPTPTPTPGSGNGGEPAVTMFSRGDSDASGSLDLTDPVVTLGFLFLGGDPMPCARAADADDSGMIDITDALVVLNYLFRGGPAPVAPFATCGADATADELGCDSFPACAAAG